MEVNKIYHGNTLDILRNFPSESIDCVITSPPYWALRDYGVVGQLGLESTFNKYMDKLIDIFREIKRVLKDTGTIWVNMGDTYYGGGKGKTTGINKASGIGGERFKEMKYKPKSLCLIPERFAIRMTDELGFILRNEIIWHKPNAMPSSVKDRFTVDFEKIYFFVKQKKYYFEQIIEPTQAKTIEKRMFEEGRENYNGKYSHIQPKRTMYRNRRTVWSITTKPFKEAHFAVFPPEIPEICIKAGCPKDGIVLDPFIGSGTTAEVAIKLGRRWVGIELNYEYIKIANKRISSIQAVINFE